MINLLNAGQYIESFLKIKTKEKKIIPLRFNQAQHKLYKAVREQASRGKPVRLIILKARQMGFSTESEALIFHGCVSQFNANALIVAHREDSTGNLFRMSKLFYEELPTQLKPMIKNSNAQELLFENPTRDPLEKKKNPGLRSRIRCVTAGGKGIGRSDTLQYVHASEYAFWPEGTAGKSDTLSGILQAVPSKPGTMVIIESTANGFDHFKELWDMAVRGESDFVPLFFAWYENPEYTMEGTGEFEWTSEEERLRGLYNLTDGQLLWRRWCIANNCNGNINQFKQEYPSSADEAFLFSGQAVFDNEIIIRRREEVRSLKPVKAGEFIYNEVYDTEARLLKIENIRFEDRERGLIKIYKEPAKGRPYVIGGDTAGEGSDRFTGMVLDNTDASLCAVLCHQFGEDQYAKQLYCLGQYYNTALIGPEVNFSSYPVRVLENLRYPKLYVRISEDSYTHKPKELFGFRTDRVTRPLIIANLVTIMREMPELVCDYDTLGEMLTFVKNEDGKPEALAGKHDDLIMGLAIAHWIRPQQAYIAEEPLKPGTVWTKDMHEDYRRADAEGKRYLIEKWGAPK